MSDHGGEQGPTMTTGLPFHHQTSDFFSRYITNNSTEIQVNGSPFQLLKTPPNAYESSRSNGYTPPPLAFSPSPTKLTGDGSTLNSSFCHSLNVDECVAFLDQEIRVLGFGSLYNDNSRSLDIIKLVNCMHSVLNKYQNSLRVREDIENRQKRSDSDMENLQISQQRLKEALGQKERDVTQAQESERQARERMKNLTELLKAEKDEVRRLNSVIQHKDAQYKHDLKKKEREHNKLKETLQSRRMERSADRKAGLEISENLLRPDGKRAKWKTQEAHEGELFRTVIADYEERQKDLLAENSELRQCLKNLQKEITNATSQPNLDNSFSTSDSEEDFEDLDRMSTLSVQSENELTEGLFEMPFSLMRDNLEKLFRSRLRNIRRLNKQLHRNGENNGNITTEPHCDKLKQDKEMERLNKQIDRYRGIIQQQEHFIQDRFEGVGGDSLDSSMLRDSYLCEEYDALEHARKMLQHEKAVISEEKRYLSKTKQQLSRQQQALDEQTNLVKNQFFNITPFRENHCTLSGSTARRKQRLLPSTPRFSSSSPVKTPTTAQLYRFLGLEQRMTKYDNNSDGEGDLSAAETSPDIESPRGNMFNVSNGNSHSFSPCASPHLSARINEHKENIKMTLMQKRTQSPDDAS